MAEEVLNKKFDEYARILSYFESIGIKNECPICHNGDLIPFDEPVGEGQIVEYTIGEEVLKRRLPAFILLCSSCGFMRKHSKLAIDVALEKIKDALSTEGGEDGR